MISKELLSEVLGEDIEHIYNKSDIGENYVCYMPKLGCNVDVNIYELAHKCKEWLKNNVSNACSGFDNGHRNFCHIENYNIQDRFYADSEPESIFKACDYILKELSNTLKKD